MYAICKPTTSSVQRAYYAPTAYLVVATVQTEAEPLVFAPYIAVKLNGYYRWEPGKVSDGAPIAAYKQADGTFSYEERIVDTYGT